jgi:hypothetical protein
MTPESMKLYLVEREETIGWNEYLGHVIAAYNEEEALSLAIKWADGEGPQGWEGCNIELIGRAAVSEDEPRIILSDYKAG